MANSQIDSFINDRYRSDSFPSIIDVHIHGKPKITINYSDIEIRSGAGEYDINKLFDQEKERKQVKLDELMKKRTEILCKKKSEIFLTKILKLLKYLDTNGHEIIRGDSYTHFFISINKKIFENYPIFSCFEENPIIEMQYDIDGDDDTEIKPTTSTKQKGFSKTITQKNNNNILIKQPLVHLIEPYNYDINISIFNNIESEWEILDSYADIIRIVINTIVSFNVPIEFKKISEIDEMILKIHYLDKIRTKKMEKKISKLEKGIGFIEPKGGNYIVSKSFIVDTWKNTYLIDILNQLGSIELSESDFSLIKNSYVSDFVNNKFSELSLGIFLDENIFFNFLIHFLIKMKNSGEIIGTAGRQCIKTVFDATERIKNHADCDVKKSIGNLGKLSKILETYEEQKNEEIKKKENEDEYSKLFSGELVVGCDLSAYFFKEKNRTFNKKSMMRILSEISSLEKDLTANVSSTIFFRYDEEKIGFCMFMITGPSNTPYDSACYIFKMTLPHDYPLSPPIVSIINNSIGTRLNPNFMGDGSICISLLNSRYGNESERWNPSMSNMMQVMLSIQSLILCENPYFNEPIHSTDISKESLGQYNNTYAFNSIRMGMINVLESHPDLFKDVILKHFTFKKRYILKNLNKLSKSIKKSNPNHYDFSSSEYKNTKKKLFSLMGNL